MTDNVKHNIATLCWPVCLRQSSMSYNVSRMQLLGSSSVCHHVIMSSMFLFSSIGCRYTGAFSINSPCSCMACVSANALLIWKILSRRPPRHVLSWSSIVDSRRDLQINVQGFAPDSPNVHFHILDRLFGTLYALRVLRNHGLPTNALQDVFRATIIAKLTYCAPAWSGRLDDRARLDAFLRRSKRYGYCPDDVPTITDLFTAADESLF